jgi:hypothetical protein
LHIRTTQRRLEVVERKLAELDGRPVPDDGGSGGILGPLRSLGRILSGI